MTVFEPLLVAADHHPGCTLLLFLMVLYVKRLPLELEPAAWLPPPGPDPAGIPSPVSRLRRPTGLVGVFVKVWVCSDARQVWLLSNSSTLRVTEEKEVLHLKALQKEM